MNLVKNTSPADAAFYIIIIITRYVFQNIYKFYNLIINLLNLNHIKSNKRCICVIYAEIHYIIKMLYYARFEIYNSHTHCHCEIRYPNCD